MRDATVAYAPNANPDATSGYAPTANSGYTGEQNFDKAVESLIAGFVSKVESLLGQNTLQLQPSQIQQILSEIGQKLSGLRYNPQGNKSQDDLHSIISQLYRAGNTAPTPKQRSTGLR